DRILNERPVDRTGTLHYGGRGAKSLLLCGAFELDSTLELLASLPTVLVLDTATNGLGRWLDPMIDLVRNEVHGKPGDAAVVARVAAVFLTDVLRESLAAAHESHRSQEGSVDACPEIAAAVAVMRERPDEPWTIARLARHVGMSRSSFATSFRAATGNSPINYLTRLRLAQAAGALAVSTRPLVEIARAAGYDNESSFSKAVTRLYGQSPGRYRRARRTRTLY